MFSSLLIDSHVHIHPSFDLSVTLKRAFINYSDFRMDSLGVMFLVERSGDRLFDYLTDKATVGMPVGSISLSLTGNRESLLLTESGSKTKMVLVAGRQIVTQERLEVLSVGSTTEPSRELTLEQAIEFSRTHSAFPILPWSPGKWIGKRRVPLDQALRRWQSSELAIGDIGMRPWIFPELGFMKKARLAGYQVLAGSDPLPLSGEEGQIFRYASFMQLPKPVELEEVWPEIKRCLNYNEGQFRTVGRRNGLIKALTRSVKLRLL